jgi:nucleotide-binding universal stress UspA family protein
MREYREFTMKRIMVATDFSDVSYVASSYAKQLAKCFAAKVLLVHIVNNEQTTHQKETSISSLPEHMDTAEAEMQRMASAFSYDDVLCSVIMRTGQIRQTILDLIKERDVDLLVVGTHGKGHKHGEELGSVAETLLRAAPCPVLTVSKCVRLDACENTHERSVLFPTDFSEPSHAVLPYAESLVRYLGGRMLLLHVDEKQTSSHKEEFQALMKEMKYPTIVSESITRLGCPADAVVAVSTEKHVDFIVMGVHGADQAGKAHNYGTAFDVIRRAKCPVFTLFTQYKDKTDEKPQEEMTEAEEFQLQQQRLAVHHS